MRTISAETQLRKLKSELKRRREEARIAEGKARSMVIGISLMGKLIGVTCGALPVNDPWRPHFESWVSELEAIKKIGLEARKWK